MIAAGRYHRGLAPLLITTGGINRHNGIVEGREFARLLTAADVPGTAVRVEDQSAGTWQNIGLSLSCLREALSTGLRLTVVSKWYHRRTVHVLRTLLPEAGPFYAISWEPLYAGVPVTRNNDRPGHQRTHQRAGLPGRGRAAGGPARRRIVRKAARRAGIAKAVTPHTLRHAFITAALDAGVPLRDVQEAASGDTVLISREHPAETARGPGRPWRCAGPRSPGVRAIGPCLHPLAGAMVGNGSTAVTVVTCGLAWRVQEVTGKGRQRGGCPGQAA